MQVEVQKLEEEYRRKMSGLFEEHAKQMRLAQEGFEKAVAASTAQMQALMEGATKEEEEPAQEERPEMLAVWSKTPSGEDCLILNREAAIMQLALLDQLADLLKELQKLAPNRKVR